MKSLSVKKGDTVLVIAGKDKGKTGKVSVVNPEQKRVVVEGVNIVTKHKKARTAQDKGGLIKQEASIDASNVQVVCPSCNKATRVAKKIVAGKKVRVCKHCGASLDAEKKADKKEEKASSKKTTTAKKTSTAKKTTTKKTTTTKSTTKKAPAKKTSTAKKPVESK